MGWHRTGARQGGQADDAAEGPVPSSRNGFNVLGRDGTAVVQKGRCGYAPDISPNNNNVQKDDGGQTAFIIMKVNDTRREASGRNMRDLYHGLNDTGNGNVAFKIDSLQGTDSLAKRNR